MTDPTEETVIVGFDFTISAIAAFDEDAFRARLLSCFPIATEARVVSVERQGWNSLVVTAQIILMGNAQDADAICMVLEESVTATRSNLMLRAAAC